MCVVCGCSQTQRASAPQAANGAGAGTGANAAAAAGAGAPAAQAAQATEWAAPAALAEGPRVDPRSGDLDYGAGAARVSVPGLSQARAIKLEQDILGSNDRVAAQNRAHFAAHGVLALNLVSSPGSGKTTLLCATIEALRARHPALPVAVIEGDQQTAFDAERIRATGAPAIQVNTGKGCHLDAPMVAAAFEQLHRHPGVHVHEHPHPDSHAHAHEHTHSHPHGHDLAAEPALVAEPAHEHTHGSTHAHEHPPGSAHGQTHSHAHTHQHAHEHDHTHGHGHAHAAASLLFIENVGNLVCPALWDLGERAKVAILSVTEGEDKPLKYPDMFAAARLMILNKIDLLPHLRFDVARCIELARRVNPSIEVLQLSASTGAGMDDWLHWLEHELGHAHDHGHDHGHAHAPASANEQALRQRVAALEAELAQLRARA